MPIDTEPLVLRGHRPSGAPAALVVDPMPNSRAAAVGLWFDAGSAYEAEGEGGLSHFVEHMLFKGAGELDAAALSRVVDREGGNLNAFTERENVCLHCTIPAAKAELALRTLADMTYAPRFEPRDFELEKDIIVSEILAADDDLEESGQDEFYAMSYPAQAIGRRIAGTAEAVAAHRFEALVDFHRRRFVDGPVLMAAAGDVDLERLKDLFYDRIATGGAPRDGDGPEAGWGSAPSGRFVRERRLIRATGSQVYFFTGLPLEGPLVEDDYWKLSVVSSAYGESMSSRLFMKLREREGLCYSIGTSMSFSRLAGLWGVSSACSPGKFPRFAAAYRDEARLLYERGLTAEELSEATGRIGGMVLVASDDAEYRMNRAARQFLFSGEVESLARSLERLKGPELAEPEAMAAYIRARLDPDREAMLMYGKLGKRVEAAAAAAFGAVADTP